MTVAAMAVPVFFYPGAYHLYGPALVIFILLVAIASQIRQAPSRFSDWNFKNAWKPITLLLALTFFLAGFVALFDIAHENYREQTFASDQFNRVVRISDHKGFRQVALDFHSVLLNRKEGPTLKGDSKLVPEEIRRLNPIRITAADDCLCLQMTKKNDAMVIIYPPDSKLPRIHGTKIADDLFYWHIAQ